MKRIVVAAALAAGFLSHAASAETLHFHGTLAGASEVPPKTSNGKGECDATYDTATRTLNYTITYTGLSGPATMAHFHGPADPDKNAPIVVPFSPPTSPIKGSTVLTEAQAADLMAGKWYGNVHTAANPGGEIRCQMMPVK